VVDVIDQSKRSHPVKIVTIGIDIAKSVFHVHGVEKSGAVVLRKRLSRGQFLDFMKSVAPCLIGMEACGSAHHWARQIAALGHEVKLMPAQYVKPYVKRNKTDMADAEAICEAVTRPTMRFVEIKSTSAQAVLLQHRSRELLVKQRTMLVNAVRAHMAEFGIIAPQGLRNVSKLRALMEEQSAASLPSLARDMLELLFKQIETLTEKIDTLEKRIAQWHRESEICQRLASIPGVGPLTATAILASVGNAKSFKTGRAFAAWLGLTPLEHSTGGKQRLGGISKRGDGYLRRLLVHGARAVVRTQARKNAPAFAWLDNLLARKHKNTATVALANKNARIIWAVLTKENMFTGYDSVNVA
jgi:transposase